MMNEPEGHSTVDLNPFSPSAVARISDRGSDMVTIPTPAIREALGYLDTHLSQRTRTPSQAGSTIAVIGDYGTGKTHLAVALLAHARASQNPRAHTVYLDAPADTFVGVNRSFMARIHRAELRERLREYFINTTVPGLVLPDPGFGPDVELTDAEQTFAQRLESDLIRVTRTAAFGVALTLLLRPACENAVWEWLMGYPADPALLRLGVAAPADVEATAIEAMGVVASIYAHGSERFVVVLDELDKVLSASSRSGTEAAVRFEQLLDVFASAGAFLMIAGLPDLLQVLSPRAKQRIGPIVRMSPLSSDDVERFICTTQLRASGEAQLAPFSGEVVKYLTSLADGVPRRVIRMCYHLYQRATESHTQVSHAMVRDVLRTYFDLTSKQDVRAEVRRVLNADGWFHQRDHLIGPIRSLPVDFWIPVEDHRAGCCVVLTESVLKSEEVEDFNRRVVEIRAEIPDSETILVVVGHLPSDLGAELADTYGIEPIVYDPHSFADQLSAAVKAVMRRLEQATGADAMTSVRHRVERIHRQQAHTQHTIELLTFQLDELRAAVELNFQAVERRLVELPGAWPGDTPTPPVGTSRSAGPSAVAALPAPVQQTFLDALDQLDELTRLDSILMSAFAMPAAALAGTPEDTGAGWVLRSREALRALGTAELLRQLIEAFRAGVARWYAARPATSTPDSETEIDRVCGTYDAVAEYLPLFQLDMLTGLATLPAGRSEPGDGETRRTDVRTTFDGLGARVRQMLR